jgi:hypothetical protein
VRFTRTLKLAMPVNTLLTHDELVALSGYRMPKYQIRWLKQNGFAFRVAADGYPRVDRTHYTQVMGAGGTACMRPGPRLEGLAKKARDGAHT